MNLETLFTTCQRRLDNLFNQYLKNDVSDAPELQNAMAYSVYNGGKRIRPAFVYASHSIFNAPLENCDIAACAVEFIHAYSLIHDDLPSMDNSDLRRGKPSNHKMFGDAIAILAGDTLQPLAFEIIATHPAPLSPEQRVKMTATLAHASGFNGMTAGQTLDIKGVNTLETLTEMYQLKTGALLKASLQLGAIAANIQDNKILKALDQFAQSIGLAFQIQDDLLDIESPDTTGKPQRLDVANNKITYPSLLGIEKTHTKIDELFTNALTSITILGEKGEILRELAHYLMQRKM